MLGHPHARVERDRLVILDVREKREHGGRRAPDRDGMDFNSAWLYGHLTYTIDASPEGSTLHQRQTVRLRWPLQMRQSRISMNG